MKTAEFCSGNKQYTFWNLLPKKKKKKAYIISKQFCVDIDTQVLKRFTVFNAMLPYIIITVFTTYSIIIIIIIIIAICTESSRPDYKEQ